MKKLFRFVFCWFFLPVLLSVIIFLSIVILPPRTEGLIAHSRPGIGNITIYRDNFSIPHIYAANKKDALYGTGWVHAQDRLWNMDIKRRMIKGRVSEIGGPNTLSLDRFMRTVGIHRAGVESASALPQDLRELAQAYADGINDYVHSITFLPLEFYLTGARWEPWTVEDCFAQFKLLMFGLGPAWVAQMQRQLVADHAGRQKASEWLSTANVYDETLIIKDDELKLLNLYDEKLLERVNNKTADGTVRAEIKKKYAIDPDFFKVLSDSSELDSLIKREIAPLAFGGATLGSNNWVVSGNHTATGKPYLANDPHLGTGMPSIWYNIELVIGEKEKNWFNGVGMAGIPFVVLGRSDYLAFGVTTLVQDTTDLFEETLNKDGTHYYYEGKWYPLKFIKEVIKVKGLPDVEETIRITRHGPILPQFTYKEVPLARFGLENQVVYSHAWVGRLRNDTTFEGMRRLLDCKDLNSAIEAMKLVPINQNAVIATKDNHIAYVGMGRFIKRAHFENNPFVKNGSSAYDEWIGITGPEDVIVLIDPPKGYIVSANNRVASSAIKFGTTQYHYSTARAFRIEELIKEKIASGKKITMDDMKAIQLDVVDAFAREEFPGLLKIADAYKTKFKGINTTKVDEALQLAKGWNGSMDENSVGALIFGVWEATYYSRLFQQYNISKDNRLGLANGYWMEQHHFASWRKWNKNPEDDSHLDYCIELSLEAEAPKPACIYQIVKAFEETTDVIRSKLGSDKSQWKWGLLHPIEYPHAPMSMTPLKFWFHRAYPGFGNKRTVNVAIYFLENGFSGTYTANYRLIANMDDSRESYYTIDSGISGNSFSKHYDDQQKLHQKGEYVRMTFGPESFGQYAEKLELHPKK